MITTNMLSRQQTLFDDETTDEKFIKEELRRLRKLELEQREKEALEAYNKQYMDSRPLASDVLDKYEEKNKESEKEKMELKEDYKRIDCVGRNLVPYDITTYDKKLSKEQESILNFIEVNQDCMFIDGVAGTGKTELIKCIKKYVTKNGVILASTGITAINSGGKTVHSFFCLSTDYKKLEETKDEVNKWLKRILMKIDYIIIEEISMINSQILEVINRKCKIARNSALPFGGIQIICFGDPLQLSPVITDEAVYKFLVDVYGGINFFDAPVFKNNDWKKFELRHVFRQKDIDFVNLLNRIRLGDTSQDIIDILNTRVITDENQLDDDVIRITSRRNTAEMINNERLRNINEKEYIYNATITGNFKESNCSADKELHLKVGAKVIMLNNDDNWVNGTPATISYLDENTIKVKIKDNEYKVGKNEWKNFGYSYNEITQKLEEKEQSKFTQFPVKLSWASTIHKAQGLTLESVLIDLGTGAFASGQLYVALSRCKSLDKVYLKRPITAQDIFVDLEALNFMKNADIMLFNEEENCWEYTRKKEM